MPMWQFAQSTVHEVLDYVRKGGLDSATDVFGRNNLGVSFVRVVRSPDSGFHTVIEPGNLLALIWIEVAQTIAGAAEIRACKVCQKPMLIGGYTGGKRTKETCSARCRFAAYQARKNAKAVEHKQDL